MPIAPPTSRVVSLTAEPTPALSWGREETIDSVDGGMSSAMPAPRQTKAAASFGIGRVDLQLGQQQEAERPG